MTTNTGTRTKTVALSERVGKALGAALSPLVGAATFLRRSRLFHPEGAVYRAELEALPGLSPELDAVGKRLEGAALVRFSGAWWKKGREWIDALGLAIRLRRTSDVEVTTREGDQDLLLATIRHPLTTLLAPTTTNTHDFLGNDYYAVSPFDVRGLGRVKWRVTSPKTKSASGENGSASRGERLDAAVARGDAVLQLELRRKGKRQYEPLARLRILERVHVDQEALRFNPFLSGRGIEPRGLVHAMRRWTYPTGQAVRPSHA